MTIQIKSKQMEKVITKERLEEVMTTIRDENGKGNISDREMRGYCCLLEVLFTDMYDEAAHELNIRNGDI